MDEEDFEIVEKVILDLPQGLVVSFLPRPDLVRSFSEVLLVLLVRRFSVALYSFLVPTAIDLVVLQLVTFRPFSFFRFVPIVFFLLPLVTVVMILVHFV